MYCVSTQTFVVYGKYKSGDFDLAKAFNDVNMDQSVMGCKYGCSMKGAMAPFTVEAKNYLKCMTLSIGAVDKKMSVKIFKNGTIQVTGCKSIDHVLHCIKCVYNMLEFDSVESVEVMSVMMNANFDCGFKINREKLGQFLIETRGMNIPPLTAGYMGIKVTIPIFASDEMAITRYSWTKDHGFREIDLIMYSDYFLTDAKKRDKKFKASIGIFQNGKILVSSVDKNAVDIAYKWVSELFVESRSAIEITRKPIKTLVRD